MLDENVLHHNGVNVASAIQNQRTEEQCGSNSNRNKSKQLV